MSPDRLLVTTMTTLDAVALLSEIKGIDTPKVVELRQALGSALVEEPSTTDAETLGPCGCIDYHMADCPLLTDRGEADPPDVDDDASESERRYAYGDR